MIIDCELRVFHPLARSTNYACAEEPILTEKIYNHIGFKCVKDHLSATSHIRSMKENGVDFGLISGLAWQTPERRLKNNDPDSTC